MPGKVGSTRKELRKQKRQAKKQVPLKVAAPAPLSKILVARKTAAAAEVVTTKGSITGRNSRKSHDSEREAGQPERGKKIKAGASDAWSKKKADPMIDPMIAAEEKELERLEKLLGFKKKKSINSSEDEEGAPGSSKAKFSERLNKEFSMYEGLGDDMGNFLMELDEIGSRDPAKIEYADSYDSDAPEEDASQFKEHILEDHEQEPDDMDEAVYSDTDEEEDDESQRDRMKSQREADESIGADSNQSDDVESEDEEEEGVEHDDEEEDDEGESANDSTIYHPVTGEDIYGRAKDSSDQQKDAAYVPPARRKLAVIDESSEGVQMIRKQMNGLMNRLTEQSRDSILRSMKGIFDSNSTSVCCTVLKDLIMSACANPTQMMTSLIPVYASMIAALHYAIGLDVGAFIVEHLTSKLHSQVLESNGERGKIGGIGSSHPLMTSKLSNNCLLLLVYLYGARILHHDLVVGLMQFLSQQRDVEGKLGEKQVELLVCLVDGCGQQLRSDDPAKLQGIINVLSSQEVMRAGDESSRVKHLLTSLTELKNNKSKRQEEGTVTAEIKKLRKWLGGLKTTFASSTKNYVLRVSLEDLLNAEKKGRWWRAGASWVGRDGKSKKEDEEDKEEHRRKDGAEKEDSSYSAEEQLMLKIATKMRLNTDIRKRVFLLMMSSRDVVDAFERLARLDLKGRQDREVVRVLVECCGQERDYNSFYPELAGMMCSQNRQFKTTLQFCLWDLLKGLTAGDVAERRVINLARMFAHLVSGFHLPLSVLKPVDISELPSAMILFLATFFMALFSSDIPEDTFQSIFDRVASTKDFAAVKGVALFFLNKHFAEPPTGLASADAKRIKKRRKMAIKALQSLNVLEYVPGKEDL